MLETLRRGDERFDDHFGNGVAITGDGTEIAVGAFWAGENTGAAVAR